MGRADQPEHHSKEEGKDQESIQSSTTPDPGHHMGKTQENITQKRVAKMLALSQQVTTRLQGTDKTVWRRQTSCNHLDWEERAGCFA